MKVNKSLMINFFIRKKIKEFAKKVAFKYLKIGKPNYPYNIEPIQISKVITELERLKEIKGNFLEIGVARGLSTRFFSEHIVSQNLEDSLIYYTIDTFKSFEESHLNFEVEKRGKDKFLIEGFAYNDFETWKKNFSYFEFIKPIESDCTKLDYKKLSPIKLVFLDVDLYLPTKKTLELLYEELIDGGCIIVDDVKNNTAVDGAYQAYLEFCEERNIKKQFIGNKCGLIYK